MPWNGHTARHRVILDPFHSLISQKRTAVAAAVQTVWGKCTDYFTVFAEGTSLPTTVRGLSKKLA